MDDNHSSSEFERYVALVKRLYERMERENSWPWENEEDEQD